MKDEICRSLFSLALVCALSSASARATQRAPQSEAAGAEYRKLDRLLSFVRKRNAEQFAIRSGNGIDEAQFVTIGGIEQWITIRGWNRDNPVLLFLHGGPGDVTNPWSFTVFRSWEKYFTLVQWDQRGAGRTLRKNGAEIAPTITLARMVEDGIELSDYLRKHLGKAKIIIVGHSFGSILGLQMARAKPDLFYAYVGTAQVADSSKNYLVAYEELLKKARATDNQQATDELARVGAPPYKSGEGYAVQRKWSNAFEGADQFLLGTLGLALSHQDIPYKILTTQLMARN